MSNMNRIFIIVLFAILGAFIGLSVSNYLSDQKHKQKTKEYVESVVLNNTTAFDESNPNVFVAYQDGLKFTFYVNEDPNIIDIYVTDADGTHEFKSNGQVVAELHHTFKFELENDLDRGFVKRQYKYLIKEFYKHVALKYE